MQGPLQLLSLPVPTPHDDTHSLEMKKLPVIKFKSTNGEIQPLVSDEPFKFEK